MALRGLLAGAGGVPGPAAACVGLDVTGVIEALAAIVREHADDPDTGGRLALDALRAAGACWRDVLPWWPTGGGCRCPRAVADRVRFMVARIDLVRAFDLAKLAVLLAKPMADPDPSWLRTWDGYGKLPDPEDEAALQGIINRFFDAATADRAGRLGELA